MESIVAKRLWHIVRAVYYMLRKGISKRKLLLWDLHHVLHRGKIAGKALGNLMTFHHHHHHHHDGTAFAFSRFSCRSMDPNLSFYNPREVEFSCSDTPAYPSFFTAKRKHRHRHDCYNHDVAAIAKAFEILNSEVSDTESLMASPSPAPIWSSFGRSPAVVRQLRITDSPFPIREEEEEEEEADGQVDRAAEEFIKRFYEQLRLQRSVAATPDYAFRREPLVGRA
ncbi:uncharacterized protein LOC103708427 [Phoenix dactylifera]|uniref:Uncharacterized protein LOC103708427 n=1 Tax=Phoenix dactylifera TaxID=42345 RepID=A0A8B7C4G2_PHODC|nr:uncharacterized protein LOC103708427 [Phoenix dactylifera]